MKKYNFNAKVYSGIPGRKMTQQEFKNRVMLSSQTQRGIFLNRMDKKDFNNWIGNENVENGEIKVYRGIPKNVRGILRSGDFVTMNELYAYKYGDKVISRLVPLNKLRYVMGHKNGNPESVSIFDKGVQPVELIYVDSVDNFNKAFKSFQYTKYCEYVGS